MRFSCNFLLFNWKHAFQAFFSDKREKARKPMETERIRVKKYIILQRTYVFWQPTSLVQISPSSISRESVRKKTLNDDNLPSLRRLCIFLRRHCVDAARLPGCPAAWLLCAVWFTSVIAWWDSRVYVYTGMSVCVCARMSYGSTHEYADRMRMRFLCGAPRRVSHRFYEYGNCII